MNKQDREQEKAARQYARLQKMAQRAAIARDQFEEALEKAKASEWDWADMCERTGVARDSDAGDWMC